LCLGYDCEIDIWGVGNGLFYLGHDKPIYEISLTQLLDWKKKVWVHAKNNEAMIWLSALNNSGENINIFSHDKDAFTFTSNGTLWCYPSHAIIEDGVNLMPELNAHTKEKLKNCYGVCSDYVERFK
jgi:hypothetical protein